jgi:hypothetical protein
MNPPSRPIIIGNLPNPLSVPPLWTRPLDAWPVCPRLTGRGVLSHHRGGHAGAFEPAAQAPRTQDRTLGGCA